MPKVDRREARVREGTPKVGYGAGRLAQLVRPRLTVSDPPTGVRFERDVEVAMKDGTILRVNVARPQAEGRYPVLMCAHPYRKDSVFKRGRFGYKIPLALRSLLQSTPIQVSARLGCWEAPDPAFWVPRGYVLINCDLRGFGRSDGQGTVFSDAEAHDYRELIEWAATQPWSTGRVGLNGVSYLAISQWKVAALQPEHLAAICAWEGFTDMYRDVAYPGGVLDEAFLKQWNHLVQKCGRCVDDVRAEQLARPVWDDWWEAHTPELERIEVPALICASFSDHNLHTRGSFEAFRRISSQHRWLYTHRGGKWATYYSEEALAFQARFFDCFLKDADNRMRELAPVRLEVRQIGGRVHAVRHEQAWPLPQTRWTPLYLHADGSLQGEPAAQSAAVSFATPDGRASFTWPITEDIELSGPMKLRLHVQAQGADDLNLFVGVRKLRDGRHVVFEGSYGFTYDMVTRGWMKVSHRALDEERSEPWRPVHRHEEPQSLRPGEIVPVEIELLPSATLFRGGEQLRLDVQGRWFFHNDPVMGQFPADYEPSEPATALLHCGGDHHDAHLLVPVTTVAEAR